ncbi:TIGR00282 family metallophosphoesterase [bacterium]|nr:TIGR00282 family metallophosphoesterase [bacterium]
MRILFVGDVIGSPGRKALAAALPHLVEQHDVEFTIANGENAAGGIGITESTASDLFRAGVNLITGGNHIWDKRDGIPFVASCDRLVRPANYPPGTAGTGHGMFTTGRGNVVGVVNLQGRAFMQAVDCPFRVGSELVDELLQSTPVVLVDIHAEATAEKLALGWHLAGRASAVLGTHTHIQTADERILEGHTAYITDVGMTGPDHSVIGVRKELSIARFLTQLPQRFEVAGGSCIINAVLLVIDEETGAAKSIERIEVRTPGD